MNGKQFLDQYTQQRLPSLAPDTEKPGRYLPEITNDLRDLPLQQPPYRI